MLLLLIWGDFSTKKPVLTQQKVESQALASTINGSYHNWQHTIPIVPAITGSSIIPSMVVEFGKTSTEARTGCGRTPWGSCEIALVTSTCRDGKKMGRFLEKRTWGYYSHPLGISWDCNGMWQLSLDISNADISLDIRKAMIFGRVSKWGISLKWGLVIFMDIMIIYDLPVDYLQRNPTVHHDRQQCFLFGEWFSLRRIEENRGECVCIY